MNYLYVLFPFIVWTISQTIKFFIRMGQKNMPTQLKGMFWTYVWAGGTPSTHTAVLTSSLVLVWHHFGLSPLSTFCTAITMLWLYDMTSDRKRQEVMNEYLMDGNDENLKRIVRDGSMLDLAGHTIREVVWGAILGIVLGSIGCYIITA